MFRMEFGETIRIGLFIVGLSVDVPYKKSELGLIQSLEIKYHTVL